MKSDATTTADLTELCSVMPATVGDDVGVVLGLRLDLPAPRVSSRLITLYQALRLHHDLTTLLHTDPLLKDRPDVKSYLERFKKNGEPKGRRKS